MTTTEERVDRGGCNASEAALLWAVVEHGGDADVLDGVEPGPAAELRPKVEAAAGLDFDERSELSERWRNQDAEWRQKARRRGGEPTRLASHWRKAVDATERMTAAPGWLADEDMARALRGIIWSATDDRPTPPDQVLVNPEDCPFDRLLQIDRRELLDVIGRFGVFELAELLRNKNRRRVARVLRKLSEERGELLIRFLKRERTVERQEKVRIREVFVTLSKHVESFEQKVNQLGLYSVACASGYRFRRRVEVIGERLPSEPASKLRQFYQMSYMSTRRGLGQHFRRALEEFLEWHMEQERDD